MGTGRPDRDPGRPVRLRSVFWACAGGLIAAAVLRSPPLAFATLAASAIAALVTVARGRLFTAVRFERSLSRRVVPWGGELEVTVSVTNDKLLPLVWLRVSDQWPSGLVPHGFDLRRIDLLGRQELLQTVSVHWYERLRRRYHVDCVERGVHRFGPVELEAGDPFGIAGVEQRFAAPRAVTVLPRVLEVPGFDLLLGRPLVEAAAARSLTVDPTALRGTRLYRPGDSVGAVNWRATARTGALHTNEFDPSSLAAVRLLLDAGSLYRPWEAINAELMELLCVVAASLAAAFAGRGYAVGLASNAALADARHAPDLAPAHGSLPEVLETIARLRPFTVRDYHSVLAEELADESAEADCVVIVARLRPAVRAMLTQLRAARPVIVVFVGLPDDDEAPEVDLVVPAGLEWRRVDALAFHA
jgi:uncharacterized protein (DUF58 family)